MANDNDSDDKGKSSSFYANKAASVLASGKPKKKGDVGKHNNGKTTGFSAVAKNAAKEYGSDAAGQRVAGAVYQKMKAAGKL